MSCGTATVRRRTRPGRRKARRAYRDSLVPGVSPQGAFNAAYESALDAATAVIREAGYRVQAPTRHHWVAFYALQGLDDPVMARLGAALDATRTARHRNVYEPEDDDEAATRRSDQLHGVLAEFLPEVYQRLVSRRPSLRSGLEEPGESP